MIVKTEYSIIEEQTYDQEANISIVSWMIRRVTTDHRGIKTFYYREIPSGEHYDDLIEPILEAVKSFGGFR